MKVVVASLYQSQIEYDGNSVKAIGPMTLLEALHSLKLTQGTDPKKWNLEKIENNDDLLIHEFLCKIHGKPVLAYPHEELCHCRMVSAEKVHQAIKQGCRSVKDIARTTLAGTGCGSCRPDTEMILKELATQN